MKILSHFLAIPVLFLLLSCESSNSYISEEEIQEKKALTGVTRLQLDGVFNLTLTQSDEESIEVDGTSELIDKLIIDQQGDLLILKMEKIGGFNFNKEDLKIRISLKDLKELDYEGVGNVKTNGLFKVGNLKLLGNGVGNLELELEAKEIAILGYPLSSQDCDIVFVNSNFMPSRASKIKTKINKAPSLAILTKFNTSMISDTHVSDVPCNLAFINPSPYLVFP